MFGSFALAAFCAWSGWLEPGDAWPACGLVITTILTAALGLGRWSRSATSTRRRPAPDAAHTTTRTTLDGGDLAWLS